MRLQLCAFWRGPHLLLIPGWLCILCLITPVKTLHSQPRLIHESGGLHLQNPGPGTLINLRVGATDIEHLPPGTSAVVDADSADIIQGRFSLDTWSEALNDRTPVGPSFNSNRWILLRRPSAGARRRPFKQRISPTSFILNSAFSMGGRHALPSLSDYLLVSDGTQPLHTLRN